MSLAHLQPMPFSKKAASSAEGLGPNLNSLQLHLERNISYRSAIGQRHQANVVNEASLVNEVFCVVFQMILKVSRIILHVGTVPVSELIAAFKSHMLIQL